MTTTKLTPAGFVIVQETHAIFGTGETAEAAWANAAEWADTSEADWQDCLVCHPATAALITEVEAGGGAIAWGQVSRICCTVAEEDGE